MRNDLIKDFELIVLRPIFILSVFAAIFFLIKVNGSRL